MNEEDMKQNILEATRLECLKVAASMIGSASPDQLVDYAEKLMKYIRAK